jgi:hypothetical protein
MDWKSKIQAAKQAGGQMLDQKTDKAIEEHWPEIQGVFQEKVEPAALAAAKDDEKMQSLFKLVYMALPFPVHLAIKEDAFIKFCFEHRDRLMQSGEGTAGERQ